MQIFESQLEDIIFESNIDLLEEKGLLLHRKRIRQLKIPGYGICDMIAYGKQPDPFYKNILHIQVIELKRQEINMNTFSQALRYVKGITRYLNKTKPNLLYTIDIVLIGESISHEDSTLYLADLIYDNNSFFGLSSVLLYTYKYTLNGMEFTNHSDYFSKNENF